MASLVNVQDFLARPGVPAGVDLSDALAALEDVSAEVRAVADGTFDATTPATVPAAVAAVVYKAARRMLINPHGWGQETIGTYSRSGGTSDGGLLTRDEVRTVRRAAGTSVTEAALSAWTPAPLTDTSRPHPDAFLWNI